VKWEFIPNILDSIFQILLSIDIIHPPLELNFKCPPNIFYDIEIRALWWRNNGQKSFFSDEMQVVNGKNKKIYVWRRSHETFMPQCLGQSVLGLSLVWFRI
jgi:hypothetical protein